MKKCEKYEALFTFGSEEDLQEHLKECADCRAVHEEMQQISSIVKEVKPAIKNKREKQKQYKAISLVASFALILLVFTTITKITSTDDDYVSWYLENQNYVATEDISVIAELGLPTDEYGLLYIE